MSYTSINFSSKKSVKEALKDGVEITCYNPGLGGDLSNFSGTVYLEGPHFPKPHRWYGKGKMVDGKLVSIS